LRQPTASIASAVAVKIPVVDPARVNMSSSFAKKASLAPQTSDGRTV
jgi:hypothetical protein